MSYLVAPLPLEGHGDSEQDGDDPREVDVADDLKQEAHGSSGVTHVG